MTNEELVKELQSDRERIPREFTDAADALIKSQQNRIEFINQSARELAELCAEKNRSH